MDIQILSRESLSAHHREKARASFLAGHSRDSHNMNPSPAMNAWVAEYDRLALAAMPQTQFARIRVRRVDSTQGA